MDFNAHAQESGALRIQQEGSEQEEQIWEKKCVQDNLPEAESSIWGPKVKTGNLSAEAMKAKNKMRRETIRRAEEKKASEVEESARQMMEEESVKRWALEAAEQVELERKAAEQQRHELEVRARQAAEREALERQCKLEEERKGRHALYAPTKPESLIL